MIIMVEVKSYERKPRKIREMKTNNSKASRTWWNFVKKRKEEGFVWDKKYKQWVKVSNSVKVI